ncbi:histidine kinase, partial [Achromatium sp. WMS3]
AFHDYPGLDKIFAKGKLDLWKGPKGQQILWEALFPTESSGPLWVGRHVDSAPITAFRNALAIRVLIIVAILVILVLMMARWIAVRLELWGKELTSGIERMLNGEEAVAFIWNNGPKEIQSLARDLTDLARAQAGYAKELEASNRYKSEFLANMSHELRTPLNSILLLSKLMADADAGLSQDQIKQARVINQAGCDLQALIENLLDHSKIEAREIAVNFEWIEPKSIIEEVIELVQPQFESKNLTLQLNIVP